MRHDSQMPREWHMIKCALLKEMRAADTFQHVVDVADSFLHARRIAEGIAKENDIHRGGLCCEQLSTTKPEGEVDRG